MTCVLRKFVTTGNQHQQMHVLQLSGIFFQGVIVEHHLSTALLKINLLLLEHRSVGSSSASPSPKIISATGQAQRKAKNFQNKFC